MAAVAAASLLAAGIPPAVAATAAPDRPPRQSQDEELIVTLRSNGVDRGEVALLRRADGDYWIQAADLARLQIDAPEAARRNLGAQAYYSFAALGAASVDFNEAELALEVVFAPRHLAGTAIDLSNRPAPVAATQPGRSLIMSYRLAASRPGAGLPMQALLDTDLNVRVGDLLLRQETRLSTADGARRIARGATQAIWDDRRTGRRVIAGDVVSSAGPYGTTITAAGVMFTKVYEMLPDVIKHPTASVQTSTALPAQVEVAVDGSTIYRTNVGPGPIALNNLMLYGGTRNVRVTVTDAAGRKEVIEQPFLFTDTVLAEGLHDYRYFVGSRSELGFDNTWHYREAAWQAFHRYGLTDHLTVSAGGEGSGEFTSGGAGVSLRSDMLGLVSLDLLASRDRQAGTTAHGWSARYSYSAPLGSLLLGHRRFDDGFRSFVSGPRAFALRDESRIGVATQLWKLSLALDLVRSSDALATRDTGSIRVATHLGRKTTISAELQSLRVNGARDWAAYLFLRRELDDQQWVGGSARATSSSRTIDIDAGRQRSQGEGLGYRAGVSTTSSAGSERSFSYLSANWNLRPASLEFLGTAPLRGGGSSYAELAVSGAVVGVDGYWGLTRRVDDGFVLARLGVPQAGVDVLVNNQVQGSTDANGVLFIPQVTSFGRQDVSVNDRQLGMQYNLPERRKTISTAYRSGTVVDFGGKQMHAVAGMAWQAIAGRRQPVAARAWSMTGPAGTLAIETGSAGDFYLEDAAAGTYQGELEVGNRRLACRLQVPASTEPVLELKEGIICE